MRGSRFTLAAMAASLLSLSAVPSGVAQAAEPPIYLGVDISYANEMDDCGAVYTSGGQRVDQFRFFKSAGANVARIRIWNDPDWTKYSNLADVKRSIRRAKDAGMQVLLDFHYSDDWADGDKQIAPKAWAKLSTPDQAKALYAFTHDTLVALNREGLTPELVQVGNETNGEIVSSLAKAKEPIHWDRNALLFNAGIKAVRDAGRETGTKPRVMLHIAQPENVEPWFAAATKAGVTDYDIIGVSYYSKWSKRSIAELGATINRLRHAYAADVLVVETAYPFTTDNADSSPNLLGADSLIAGYPATPAGQESYLVDLTQLVLASGGTGVFYWEPSWLSTKTCGTRWGKGSNWENAAVFDFKGQALHSAEGWLKHAYVLPVEVTFKAKVSGEAAFIDGDFLGGVGPRPMVREGDAFVYRTRLMPGTSVTVATAATAAGVADAPAVTATVGRRASVVRVEE
ncbi:arabinogalactan endo-1,4-beta-galactosidase [Caulobacter sp. Root487D2Y]|uniref:glycoside hydrolase family 53 protein n=1 Tax=Caulobacter sp. Root487D2Y TaxID=1736547 RepID=UPI0006FB3A34|nr:arabinogalactan endo-1,4-beta-galactosidase [Caulobacter sp. Root487D2Y]KQY35941.1 arabinogalactan endo-1,4-beta-galactosidase [Caulobacter sp. Root487D2Y]